MRSTWQAPFRVQERYFIYTELISYEEMQANACPTLWLMPPHNDVNES